MGNLHSNTKPVYRKELSEYEKRWVDLQPFLLQRGYKLRPRYHPSWKPSWKRFGNSKESKPTREDEIRLKKPNLIDAIRVRDGAKVVIKVVPTNFAELPILQYLNSQDMRADPRNKTVPVLDVLLMPNTDDEVLVIMPILMDFSVIPFRFFCEMAEAFTQFLLGLTFLHDHNIAHRDVCYLNLMMDSSKVVPKGFHFIQPKHSEHDRSKPIEYVDRRSVAPVDYYIIDFGVSIAFPQDWTKSECGAIGRVGQRAWPVPEMSNEVPYNPFKSDIYQLGYVFKKVTESYTDLVAFKSLCTAMTSASPDERPTAQEAYDLCVKIIASLSNEQLNERVWYKDPHCMDL